MSVKFLDPLDLKVLRALAKDAQESFSSIAKKIGVSPKTVQKRFNRMVEKRIIMQCSIIVDLSKLGYKGRAYLMITLKEGYGKEKLLAILGKMENMFVGIEVIAGTCDVFAVVAFKNFQDIFNYVLSVKNLPGIAQIDVDLTDDILFPMASSYNVLVSK